MFFGTPLGQGKPIDLKYEESIPTLLPRIPLSLRYLSRLAVALQGLGTVILHITCQLKTF